MPQIKNAFIDEYYEDFDDECSAYTPEQEKELINFASGFFCDLNYLVKQYIEYFFKDKNFFCGGKIPKNILNTERNIYMVVNYDIIKSVQRAYSSLKDHEISKECLGEVTGDIRMVSSILEDLSRSNIPQQFAGGMMLLYLELVIGVDIGQ